MENNNDILKNAIQNLPEYIPEENVWISIDNALSKKETLTTLPNYTPPESVWNNIEKSLSKSGQPKPVLTIRLKQIMAVAALLLIGLIVFNNLKSKNSSISHSEEWTEVQTTGEWNDNNELKNVLNLICDNNPSVCITPEYKQAKARIEQLEQSKQIILKQMNKYEPNTDLEIMLTKIELEQTGLIKQIMQKTL